MTVETEVANLVTAVDNLTSTVNTRKATLDASVADAEGARDTALTYRDTALTYKDQAEGHATTAAAEAANAASAVTWQDLAGLTFAFSETIVDGIIYDTTQDFDGGAWRFNKKASWYQEDRTTGTYLGEVPNFSAAITAGGVNGDYYYHTGVNIFYEIIDAGLGTVTEIFRAGSAEFPAVAYITAEAARVIIWDAQTGGMWMVFTVNGAIASCGMLPLTDVTSICALNGSLLVGQVNTSNRGGIKVICFASDSADNYGYLSLTYGEFLGTIADRNTVNGYGASSRSLTLVDLVVNDVAITTLPNAPIDPATGLPKSTIYAFTDGGISQVGWDGTTDTVWDNVATAVTYIGANVGGVLPDHRWWAAVQQSGGDQDAFLVVVGETLTQDVSNTYWTNGDNGTVYAYAAYNAAGVSDVKLATGTFSAGEVDALAWPATGGNQGLAHLAENPTTPSNSMVNYTTSDYSTGWMPGDIKGAWLASTDDTDLVGTELVTNGTFDTDTSGWGSFDSATLSVDTQRLKVENGGTAFGQGTQAVTTVAGKVYVLSANFAGGTGITKGQIRVGSTQGSANLGSAASVNTSAEELSVTFTASSTTTWIGANNNTNTSGHFSLYDNISVKLADADRSVNANGLAVNGTVTKTAVATCSELVAYSGFSASNYLEQPYNAALDFGTGDFCVMGWVEGKRGTFNCFLNRNSDKGVVGGLRILDSGADTILVTVSGSTLSGGAYPISSWFQLCFVRKSGVGYTYINGKLAASGVWTGNVTDTSATTTLGGYWTSNSLIGLSPPLALWRITPTIPTDEQIAKIYNDEKWMFQPGAQVTLNGSSDAVTALAHDKVTDLLHVGTSGGMSVFDGLVRVSEDATAVTTSISANDGRIVRQ